MKRSPLAAVFAAALLVACGGDARPGDDPSQAAATNSFGSPSDADPLLAGGLFLEDPHSGGLATTFELAEVGFGRVVELWAENARGQRTRVADDFVVGPDYTGDGVRSILTVQPVLGVDRLVILADVEDTAPDGGRDQFLRIARDASDSVPLVRDAGADGAGLATVVPRDAALVLRFTDLVDASDLALTAPSVDLGWPSIVPHDVRVVPDRVHGGIDPRTREFATTRLIVDLAVREVEARRAHRAIGLSPLGLPAPIGDGPSATLGLATASVGGSPVLSNLAGRPLGVGTGSVNFASAGRTIVRPFRTASASSPNSGYLGGGAPPRLVARAATTITAPPQRDPMTTDVFTLPSVAFASPGCAAAAQIGDVIRQPDLLAEIIAMSGPPVGSVVSNVSVQLISFPAGWTGPDEWTTMGVGPARYDAVYDPAMDGTRIACLVGATPAPLGAPQAPTRGVDPSASFDLWFNEPIDPDSLGEQDAALIGRSPIAANGPVAARDAIVATIEMGADMESIRVTPLVPLTHVQGASEVFHITPRLGVGSVRDLAGNDLLASPGSIAMSIDPGAPSADTDGFLLRFEGADELATGGLDIAGQSLYNLAEQRVRPRPVVRHQDYFDRTQAMVQRMTQFPPGTQGALNGLGAKLQTIWRYADAGYQLTDPATTNIDVEGLYWAPAGGVISADNFPEFQIRLSHSRWAPDEVIDPTSLFPRFQNSGLRGEYASNELANAPSAIVHDRARGYTVDPADLFQAPTGTTFMPFPMNRGIAPQDFETYTWRDTRIRERAGTGGAGVEPQQYFLATNRPIPLVPFNRPGQVQTLGLPLLMEFSTWPDANALGLNAFDISIATNSSSRPYFRAFSAGGVDTAGNTVLVDPSLETMANGGFNPGGNPPGSPTFGRDNSFQIGAADFVVRVSVSHTKWIAVGDAAPGRTFEAPSVAVVNETANSTVTASVRGASDVLYINSNNYLFDNDLDDDGVVDYVADAIVLDLYGDYYNDFLAINTLGSPQHDTNAANSGLTFVGGDDAWQSDVSAIQGARWVQVRFEFTGDIVTGTTPEASTLGLAWTN